MPSGATRLSRPLGLEGQAQVGSTIPRGGVAHQIGKPVTERNHQESVVDTEI
jgi:hypothetical protein